MSNSRVDSRLSFSVSLDIVETGLCIHLLKQSRLLSSLGLGAPASELEFSLPRWLPALAWGSCHSAGDMTGQRRLPGAGENALDKLFTALTNGKANKQKVIQPAWRLVTITRKVDGGERT